MTPSNEKAAGGGAVELKPCPFCGGASAMTSGYSRSELPWSDDGGEFYRAFCSRCQSRQLFHRTDAEATEAWNRRTDAESALKLQADRIAELEGAVNDYLEAQEALDNRELMGPNAEPHDLLMRRRNRARDHLDAALSKTA